MTDYIIRQYGRLSTTQYDELAAVLFLPSDWPVIKTKARPPNSHLLHHQILPILATRLTLSVHIIEVSDLKTFSIQWKLQPHASFV